MKPGRLNMLIVALTIAATTLLTAACSTPSAVRLSNDSAASVPRELATNSDLTETQRRSRIRLELAVGYYGHGQLPVALDEVKQAISLDPQSADAYSVRGLIYMDMGEVALANENFQRALRLAPNNPDIANNYGWFLCKNGREKEAISYFQSALKSRSYQSPAKALTNAGVCSLQIKDEVGAERYFLQAFQFDAGNPLTNANLALMAINRNDTERARFYMARLSQQEELGADVLWIAIRVEHKLGDQVAETNFSMQLRRLYPGSAEYASYEHGVLNE